MCMCIILVIRHCRLITKVPPPHPSSTTKTLICMILITKMIIIIVTEETSLRLQRSVPLEVTPCRTWSCRRRTRPGWTALIERRLMRSLKKNRGIPYSCNNKRNATKKSTNGLPPWNSKCDNYNHRINTTTVPSMRKWPSVCRYDHSVLVRLWSTWICFTWRVSYSPVPILPQRPRPVSGGKVWSRRAIMPPDVMAYGPPCRDTLDRHWCINYRTEKNNWYSVRWILICTERNHGRYGKCWVNMMPIWRPIAWMKRTWTWPRICTVACCIRHGRMRRLNPTWIEHRIQRHQIGTTSPPDQRQSARTTTTCR